MNAIGRKGWCPSLFEPMQSGDGWLTRVKPPRAVLSATAARALADAVGRFGNGAVELTSRGNLQVRGLAPDGVAPFAAAIVAAGLADPCPAIERRRAVIHPPLADTNDRFGITVEAMLATDPALANLPAKFCVAVDDGGPLPLGPTADLSVIRTATGTLVVPAGTSLGVHVLQTQAVDAVRRLALGFLRLSRDGTAPRRMRALIGTIGAETLFAAAGLSPSVPLDPRPVREAIGWLPWPDDASGNNGSDRTRGVVGLGLLSGAMDVAVLLSLADLAERYGAGEIRLTPWRAVLLPGIAAQDREAVLAAALAQGLIVDPADRRRAIITCTGQPGCAAASVDVRGDAAMLWPLALPAPVHVSGCAKGCAHRGAAPITLVGENGRYALVFDGPTNATPALRHLTMPQVVEALEHRQ